MIKKGYKFTDDELSTLSFAYSHVYDEYLKVKRNRTDSPETKKFRLKHYKEHLLRLQKIYKENMGIEVDFKDL